MGRFTLLSAVCLAALLLALALPLVDARLREGECEVCLKRMDDFAKQFGGMKDEESVHNGIRKLCKTYTDKADKRFCYYIGGSEDSATSLLRTISGPLRSHMPSQKICERLKSMDAQICEVKYEKPKAPVDWTKVDFDKMRVKELRQTLTQWGVKCEGCTEKGDFLRLLKQHLPAKIAEQQAKGGVPAADKKTEL